MMYKVVTSSLSRYFTSAVLLFSLTFLGAKVQAQEPGHGHDHDHGTESADHHGDTHGAEEAEDISQVIIHHVMDSHDWHITDIGETSIALHLPWILYNSEEGLKFFGGTHSLNEHPNYIADHSGHVFYVKDKNPRSISLEEAEANPGKYAVIGHGGHNMIYEKVEGATLIDFSITKTALHILTIAFLMLWIFSAVAKGYRKREGMAPKGVQSFFEPLILFVRDDIARPYLHEKADRFLPYLLTLFFFIWFSNLFGLTPLSSNIAGNTSITLALAFLSFILILANSTKDFWMHIFWFPGVPLALKPLMLIVEFMGLLTKPIALAIRLFANISAGHFMVLALICLIFILGDNGNSVGGALGIAPLSIGFTLFIFAVELIVAAVQAFVFALLTAVFIGQAMETHDDHH